MGNDVPEVPAHCFAPLRTSRVVLGLEKNIFGFSVFYYTYWTLVRASGRVQWDGLQWMRLDDDFSIRKVSHGGFAHAGLAVGPVGRGFLPHKKCILFARIYLTPFHPFPHVGGGRNGWMTLQNGKTSAYQLS